MVSIVVVVIRYHLQHSMDVGHLGRQKGRLLISNRIRSKRNKYYQYQKIIIIIIMVQIMIMIMIMIWIWMIYRQNSNNSNSNSNSNNSNRMIYGMMILILIWMMIWMMISNYNRWMIHSRQILMVILTLVVEQYAISRIQ